MPFQEYAVLKELNLRGGYMWLSHAPQLQSQMNIRVDCGTPEHPSPIVLRASVVHCDVGREKDRVGVGVTFIDESENPIPFD